MLKKADEFIFLDDVQYNRRSWQNRVHIRASQNLNEKNFLVYRSRIILDQKRLIKFFYGRKFTRNKKSII